MRRRGRRRARRATRARGGAKRHVPQRAGGRRREIALGVSLIVLLLAGAGVLHFWLTGQGAKEPPARAVAVIPPVLPQATPPAAVVPPPAPATPVAPEAQPVPPPTPPAAEAPPHPAEEPTWLRNATPSPQAGAKPRIAIVIDDCGLDRPRTDRAIALPAAVTLSFLPYSNDLPSQTEAARRNGHELLVHVPMQPINARLDMGPNGLAIDQPRDEVLRRLRWDLGRFDGYVGINNHMGSRFTTDRQAMTWVIGELRSRGLMFLDSRTIGSTVGESVASLEDVPYAGRDVFLDDDLQAQAVEARLMDAEAVARRKGTAIAIGHPHDATLAALNQWIATLPHAGIVLVPLTDVVRARSTAE